jgi:hypothetical protein
MKEGLVVDTGPLVALARGGALEAIGSLPIDFVAPREVVEELERGEEGGRLSARPDWLTVLLGRGALPGSDGELVLDLYLAQIVGGELALTEHRQCAWVGPQELPTLDWAAADVPLLEPLRRRLEGG